MQSLSITQQLERQDDMAALRNSLASLPDEILIQILTPLLQPYT